MGGTTCTAPDTAVVGPCQPHAWGAGAADAEGRQEAGLASQRGDLPTVARVRAAPVAGEVDRQGLRGGPAALRLRWDYVGHLLHPRPGGNPQDPAAAAPHRTTGPRSAAWLKSWNDNAVRGRVRRRAQGPGCDGISYTLLGNVLSARGGRSARRLHSSPKLPRAHCPERLDGSGSNIRVFVFGQLFEPPARPKILHAPQ